MKKLYPLIFLLVLAGSSVILVSAHEYQEWLPTNVTAYTGNLIYGNLTSIEFLDGINIRLDEVSGVPGFEIRANFTDIPSNIIGMGFTVYDLYEGNPAHVVSLEVFNFASGEWFSVALKTEHNFEWLNVSLSLNGDYYSDGNVWMRLIHHTNGVGGHYLLTDYLRLFAYVDVDPTLSPWDINWLMSIIWITLVALGTFQKNKIIIMFAGFFGLILTILMMSINMMVAVALISINLYLLYEGTA